MGNIFATSLKAKKPKNKKKVTFQRVSKGSTKASQIAESQKKGTGSRKSRYANLFLTTLKHNFNFYCESLIFLDPT